MTLERCIVDLQEKGQLSPEQAERARDVFTRHQRRFRQTMGPDAADARASQEAVASMERAAQLAKAQQLLQLRAQQRIIGDMARYRGTSRANAAMALFDHDGLAPYMNVEALRKAIVGAAHAELIDILTHHRRTLSGVVRNKDDLTDVVRELFGTKTGNHNASEMADAFRRVSEGLRQRFNAAGGAIGKLEDWGLPQRHNPVSVSKAKLDEWRSFIKPRLDRNRMIDDVTGHPLDDQALDEVLSGVFDTISTEGWIDRVPSGGGGGGKKMANRRADSRVLHFADADGWLEYQQRFGDGDQGAAFDSMIGHVEAMARDIAHMEVLGPNPAATVRWLKDGLMKEAALDAAPGGRGGDSARWGALRVQQLYDTTSGNLQAPVSTKWARRFGTVRALNVAQLLGSAFLSATTDAGFQAITRGFNGLPVTGAITGYLKLFRPTVTADQRVAIRLGLIAEEASKLGATQQRYLGESVSHEWSRRLADGVLRVSGLSPWTQAGRWAFGMEFLGTLADNIKTSFEDLPAPLRGALERYGIDAVDWSVMRAADLYEHRGSTFMSAENIAETQGPRGARHGRQVADRMMAMILTETDYAVPTASVRGRSLTTVGQPGTLIGEIARNALLFKSFGVSVVLSHGSRMAALRPVNRAIYAATFTTTLTLLGAMVIQMREIAKGRDPLPMAEGPEFDEEGRFNGGFWSRAILQGGGFGIFGDFIAAGTSERQGGIQEAIAGPVVGMAGDMARTAIGREEPSKLMQRMTPGGSLWYARLAYERLVIDELRRQTDENYDESWARMERRALERGQDFWWRPGTGEPERAPILEGAAAAPPPEE